jgi:hypothetical protein
MPPARAIPLHRPGGAAAGSGLPAGPSTTVTVDKVHEQGEPQWYRELAGLLAFARSRCSGDYGVDEFGFDPDLTDNVLLPLLRPVYRRWFRVETVGIHHLPPTAALWWSLTTPGRCRWMR